MFHGYSYIENETKIFYKNDFSNKILNNKYTSIGRLQHENEYLNFENKYKREILSVEDRIHSYDLEIFQINYLLKSLKSDFEINKVAKLAAHSEIFQELFKEKWERKNIIMFLEKKVIL